MDSWTRDLKEREARIAMGQAANDMKRANSRGGRAAAEMQGNFAMEQWRALQPGQPPQPPQPPKPSPGVLSRDSSPTVSNPGLGQGPQPIGTPIQPAAPTSVQQMQNIYSSVGGFNAPPTPTVGLPSVGLPKIQTGVGDFGEPSFSYGFRKGGRVEGPPGLDKVPAALPGGEPARLNDGEYILPAAVVEALGGAETLDRLVSAMTGQEAGPEPAPPLPGQHGAVAAPPPPQAGINAYKCGGSVKRYEKGGLVEDEEERRQRVTPNPPTAPMAERAPPGALSRQQDAELAAKRDAQQRPISGPPNVGGFGSFFPNTRAAMRGMSEDVASAAGGGRYAEAYGHLSRGMLGGLAGLGVDVANTVGALGQPIYRAGRTMLTGSPGGEPHYFGGLGLGGSGRKLTVNTAPPPAAPAGDYSDATIKAWQKDRSGDYSEANMMERLDSQQQAEPNGGGAQPLPKGWGRTDRYNASGIPTGVRYEGPRGSYMESDSPAKGGGTFSVASGPRGGLSDAQWESMDQGQRLAARLQEIGKQRQALEETRRAAGLSTTLPPPAPPEKGEPIKPSDLIAALDLRRKMANDERESGMPAVARGIREFLAEEQKTSTDPGAKFNEQRANYATQLANILMSGQLTGGMPVGPQQAMNMALAHTTNIPTIDEIMGTLKIGKRTKPEDVQREIDLRYDDALSQSLASLRQDLARFNRQTL